MRIRRRESTIELSRGFYSIVGQRRVVSTIIRDADDLVNRVNETEARAAKNISDSTIATVHFYHRIVDIQKLVLIFNVELN